MASATFTISCAAAAIPASQLQKPSKFLLNQNPPKHRRSKLSCAASSAKDQNPAPEKNTSPDTTLDRRNVLLGLSGLYGAYNLSLSGDGALASPVPAPDITKCGTATITSSTDKVPYSCCPPAFSGTIANYKLPQFTKVNVRPAAHDIDEEYLEKYKTAIRKMKELPEDDPRNFYQQANVHCAYCNGAYKLAGGEEYQVHFSWLFFPFHRWYLYFHERILQSLIGDPTFTLPYWNWDNPQGMFLPEIFDDKGSPLYDEVRDQKHHKDVIVDLSFSAGEELNTTELQILRNNLAIMYRQMVTNAPCPALFFGNALRGEGYDTKSGAGTIENVPHNTLHRWVGDPTTAHNEDMGNFYSASKDPVFYSLHGNVDRLWSVWKSLGGKRHDITDPDWLQSAFIFYDENKNLVRVKVQDCLDHKKLGYTFQLGYAHPMDELQTNIKKEDTVEQHQNIYPLGH
ncbi:unnamed protein product [Cuscuta europaea]|uniref:catechol oxidase n=1 Tax=Cuscuta europaea TaxID=41803 RepID=A0A9P1EFV4_CUSEU|nr:unnamed protein product [Cuscuta europaea]